MKDTRFDNEIDFLLEKACDSIRYLVLRDLLKTPVDKPEMVSLEEKILDQPNVKKILDAQCDDGWFGHELHGNDGMDHLIGELLNAGVEKEHPAIKKAIRALVTPEIAQNHKNWFHGGDALDKGGRGGNRAVTAQILSWVRYPEDSPLIKEQIELSLEHMSAAANYDSIDDFSVSANGKRFYKPNARFPGANHIAMLAATESWRTEENVNTVRRASARGYELMRNVDAVGGYISGRLCSHKLVESGREHRDIFLAAPALCVRQNVKVVPAGPLFIVVENVCDPVRIHPFRAFFPYFYDIGHRAYLCDPAKRVKGFHYFPRDVE